ncbi:FecR family protein [Mucilaginibacter gracilis]|uniref:FecR family protein n=1 Tax=Mucilaginibacter gracilis TaxID=423350 RepID=A0A495IUU1_9SPHI|nr:FecR domain-containing protein [Mucilaginibacter gracilis]RKR80516.1 FecR family protein [Mucilaginibacter gracilis]
MEEQVTRALLEKFLENQCTATETALVLKWLEHPGNEQQLHELLTGEWQKTIEDTQVENPSDEQMHQWKQRIRTLISEADNEKVYPVLKPPGKPFYLKYAAIWITTIIGFSAFWVFHNRNNQPPPVIAMVEKHNPYGQRSTIILPDSSIIYLGAGSSIQFPERFTGKTRDIRLTGEAFFEVVHNPKKAFIVHAAGVQTCVLGTSFKIEAFPNRPVSVSVATGKVSVGSLDTGSLKVKPLAVLLPGQMVSWDAATQKVTSNFIAVDGLTQWKQGKLVFQHASLSHMAEDLERWYKVKININNPKRAKEAISGVLPPTISVKDAMEVLSITGHFKYALKDSTIRIY